MKPAPLIFLLVFVYSQFTGYGAQSAFEYKTDHYSLSGIDHSLINSGNLIPLAGAGAERIHKNKDVHPCYLKHTFYQSTSFLFTNFSISHVWVSGCFFGRNTIAIFIQLKSLRL
jgi:hypothetical protein